MMYPVLNRWFVGFVLSSGWLGALPASAQVDLAYPVSRMVVQRDNANQATVQLVGSFTQAVDRIEARATARAAGQGTGVDWTLIQANPTGGQFSGNLTLKGGWYQLEVRGLRNGQVVGSDVVDRFGVGEVFAIIGHSNAQGTSCMVGGSDRCPTLDGATDDRVTVVPVTQGTPTFYQYELTADTRYLPGLSFDQLKTFNGISPFAKLAWFWGRMGDALVQRLNVPVMFYNSGFGGSSMEYNYKAAYDIPFDHGFIRYSIRMPIANTRNILNMYVPATGIRAILIQHGENDRGTATDQLVTYYYGVIDKLRQEYNMPNLAYIVAQSSFVTAPFDNVRAAQAQVIARGSSGYNTYQGPDLDQITSLDDRPDGLHFSPTGQTKAGGLWANAITDDVLRAIQPYPAQPQPLAGLICGPADGLTIKLPDGYTEYTWSTGDSTQTLTPGAGTYSARVRNAQKRVAFPPAVTLTGGSAKPAPPTISANGPLAYCRPGALRLTSSYDGPNQWSTGVTSATLSVPSSGTYSVQARNPVYGCLSDADTVRVGQFASDLALGLSVSRRAPAVGDTVSYTFTVRNQSSCDAGLFTLQNRLPPNVQFVASADLAVASGVVSGTVTALAAGAVVSRRYVARLTAAGMYVNAAELNTQSSADSDSSPGTGTSDGQDDMAFADLRTRPTSANQYVSPNPNPVTLPAPLSNQPAPNPNKVSLSLLMQPSTDFVRPGQSLTIVLTVANRGGLTATNIGLRHDLPNGLKFTSSASGMTASGPAVVGTIARLPAGQSASVAFVATTDAASALSAGTTVLVNTAQVMSCDQPDSDSTPGNGLTNGEKDAARIYLRLDNTPASGGRRSGRLAAASAPMAASPARPVAGHRFGGAGPK